MVLKDLKSLPISLLLILFFAVPFSGICQNNKINIDSVFTKIFDPNLYVVKSKSFTKIKKPTIIVSTTNCSGCVKYFTNEQHNYKFIFVLYNESLLDAERIMNFYKLSKKDIFFTTCDYVKNHKNEICQSPTPCCIYQNNGTYNFLDYASLSNLSSGFTMEHKALINLLK